MRSYRTRAQNHSTSSRSPFIQLSPPILLCCSWIRATTMSDLSTSYRPLFARFVIFDPDPRYFLAVLLLRFGTSLCCKSRTGAAALLLLRDRTTQFPQILRSAFVPALRKNSFPLVRAALALRLCSSAAVTRLPICKSFFERQRRSWLIACGTKGDVEMVESIHRRYRNMCRVQASTSSRTTQ